MKSEILKPQPKPWLRITLLMLGGAMLVSVYIFQRVNLTSVMDTSNLHPNTSFIVNRTLRMLLNDIACFLLIYAIFKERKYLKVAFWLFLAELFIVLPVYLVLKLLLEGDSEISSPLLSQIHRLIVNPTLMIVLIAGFVYQKYFRR
jgi:exosortase F-associated protein